MDQRQERVGSQTVYMPTYGTADLLATLACTVVGPSTYHREKGSYIKTVELLHIGKCVSKRRVQ